MSNLAALGVPCDATSFDLKPCRHRGRKIPLSFQSNFIVKPQILNSSRCWLVTWENLITSPLSLSRGGG
jgi:hypothetical protein